MRYRLLLIFQLAITLPFLGASSVQAGDNPLQMLREGLDWMERHEIAETYDKNTVISDATMLAVDSMTTSQIQSFLDGKAGVLKNQQFADRNGATKDVAQIIRDAAVGHGISPKVLLVRLQMEKGLITKAAPSQSDFDGAMGVGWYDGGYVDPKWKGLGPQVWRSAYILKLRMSEWSPGDSKSVDNGADTVYPTNGATWSLYRYTPWTGLCCGAGGNKLHWVLYWQYFDQDPLGGQPRVSLYPNASNLPFGKWTKLAGKLKDEYGNPISGADIWLQIQNGGGWSWLSGPKTNAQGYYQHWFYTESPARTYRAKHVDSGTYSNLTTVNLKSSISAWNNYRPKARYCQWSKIHGIYGGPGGRVAGAKLYLQKWNGTKWTWQATVRTNSTGYYSAWMEVCPDTRVRMGTWGSAVTSPAVTKKGSKIVVWENSKAHAVLEDGYGDRAGGIELYLQRWDGSKWVWMATCTTSSTGYCNFGSKRPFGSWRVANWGSRLASPTQQHIFTDSVVLIDPGHQRNGDSSLEPIGPGSSQKKARVSQGATGVSTRRPEYRLNLEVADRIKTLLESAGVEVVMTRTTHDVSISNKERAEMGNVAGADVVVRVHADGSTSGSAKGISTLHPAANRWTGPIYTESLKAAGLVQAGMVDSTGRQNRGLSARGDITGFNWSTRPVVLAEIGFLSNSAEDELLSTSGGQQDVADGITQGVIDYLNTL